METHRRSRVQVAALLALGGVLAAPLAWPGRDALALLAWLALLAAPTGALLALCPRPSAIVAFGVFAAALVWRALPHPGPGAYASTLCALGGLALLGVALGWLRRGRGPGREPGRGPGPARAAEAAGLAASLLLCGALLAVLPSLGGMWRGTPWPPAVAARLLDLSPLSLAVESARTDWMRHSFVYEPAGSASIGPDLRSAWGGLAGPVTFVVGCALALAALGMNRRERGQKAPPTDR